MKTERYIVVQNGTGRSSCWPIDRDVPSGWTRTTIAGTKQECLQAIRDASKADVVADGDASDLRMSLMFFGDQETDAKGDKYRLMTEAALFADRHGFDGIWLPERHFTKFGCLYPSPAVLHAAIASRTKSLKLKAGSVVMPLNDPLRVAEQWAVVDNLSGGRVELAFASGWHPDDFVLAPEAYQDRSDNMYDGIDQVRRLWRGEEVQRASGTGDSISVRTYPTPVQPELPVWLTAAGNPETFRRAGEMGVGVLTHLFNQDIGELKVKVDIYQQARGRAGHQGPGEIAVTLHTYVGETFDQVREEAGAAYCEYLRDNLGLLKQLAVSQGQTMDLETLPKAELDQMLEWMLNKFIGGRSLMGTVQSCAATCRELQAIGVTEIACLLDFGPDTDHVLSNLKNLADVAALKK